MRTLADRRKAALDSFALAESDPDRADWRALARTLAGLIPAPKPGPSESGAGGAEWLAYSDAMRRGRGAAFHPGRVAVWRFGDGEVIRTGLRHRIGQDVPDWNGAARTAVRFYRARRLTRFLRLIREPYGCGPSWGETYNLGAAVPEILSGLDLARGRECDAARANGATAALRAGEPYLARFEPIAARLPFPCMERAAHIWRALDSAGLDPVGFMEWSRLHERDVWDSAGFLHAFYDFREEAYGAMRARRRCRPMGRVLPGPFPVRIAPTYAAPAALAA